ncbi:MAG: ribonuclease P protein component [Melioribacteraceae bacterium]|nr:ribonuclease P protein component [Melioribacteraceae bacterium]
MKRFGLSASERIKSKKEFELVYSRGEILFSPSNKLKAVFFIDRSPDMIGIKTAYAVSSKSGNAVWRNRIKRLLRESYRLNKMEINNACRSKKLKLLLVFSPGTLNQTNNKKIFLKDIMNDVNDLLIQIGTKL